MAFAILTGNDRKRGSPYASPVFGLIRAPKGSYALDRVEVCLDTIEEDTEFSATSAARVRPTSPAL